MTHPSRRAGSCFLAAGVVMATASCDLTGPSEPSGPGVLVGSLLSPNGAEGAAVLELQGGTGLGTISPDGGEVYYRHGEEGTSLVVLMEGPGELRFQVRTEDVSEQPSVRVLQVSDGGDALRASTEGYTVRFEARSDPQPGAVGEPQAPSTLRDLEGTRSAGGLHPTPLAGFGLGSAPRAAAGEPLFIGRFPDAGPRLADSPGPRRAAPVTGDLPVLVIPALMADSPEPSVSAEELQTSLFDGPSPYGTVAEYYSEVSGGRLQLQGRTIPWVRTQVTLAQAVGTSYGLGSEAMTGAYLQQALAAADPQVDFARFDNDGPDGVPNSGDDDGRVDAVAFHFIEVSATCGGPGIWPHRARMENWLGEGGYSTGDLGADGNPITVNDYTAQSALDCSGTQVTTASTLAHELGHVLGLPDLYDRSQGILPEERRWVVGCWSLMAAGSWGCGTSNRVAWVRPTHLGAWEKEAMGWLSHVETVTPALEQEVTLEPVQASGRVLKVPMDGEEGDQSTEYLLMEYRTREGFDQDLPAAGVLIYHVDLGIKTNQPCDTCPQAYRVALLEADGNDALRRTFLRGGNRGEAGDAWGIAPPGRLGSSTTPSSRRHSGDPSGVTIYGIGLKGGLAHITLSTLEIEAGRLVQAFLGTADSPLDDEERAFLDAHGNQNGFYDVGDLRAYRRR